MNNTKRRFYYNKGNYLVKLKPRFETRYFQPRNIIQYKLILPFFVPFAEKSEFFYKISNEEICHFTFYSVTETKRYDFDYRSDATIVESSTGVVEVTYALKYKIDLSSEAIEELL